MELSFPKGAPRIAFCIIGTRRAHPLSAIACGLPAGGLGELSRQDMRRIDLGFAAGERHADVVHFPSPGNGSSPRLILSGLTAPHIS